MTDGDDENPPTAAGGTPGKEDPPRRESGEKPGHSQGQSGGLKVMNRPPISSTTASKLDNLLKQAEAREAAAAAAAAAAAVAAAAAAAAAAATATTASVPSNETSTVEGVTSLNRRTPPTCSGQESAGTEGDDPQNQELLRSGKLGSRAEIELGT